MKKHTTLKSKFNSAFSLVELLVVIAVIAVIAAIAIPNITGARDAAVASRDTYNAEAFINMSNQLRALGVPAANITLANLTNGTGINVTNGTNVVNFQLN
jgi:type IV pilus assembly protein PilA